MEPTELQAHREFLESQVNKVHQVFQETMDYLEPVVQQEKEEFLAKLEKLVNEVRGAFQEFQESLELTGPTE